MNPERYGIWKIESLTHPSTFYIVDPGSSRKKCLPPIAFKARTINVSSPDECHWEGNEFSKQRDDVCGITAHEAADIAQDTMDVVGTFATNQPKSAIIGYVKILRRGSHRFGLVKWRLFLHRWQRRSAQSVWPIYGGLMLQDDKVGWEIFHAYCRRLMGTPPVSSFRCHPCCRQRDDEYRHKRDFVVGGCNKVRMGLKISSAVFEVDSMTLFHSIDPYHK